MQCQYALHERAWVENFLFDRDEVVIEDGWCGEKIGLSVGELDLFYKVSQAYF